MIRRWVKRYRRLKYAAKAFIWTLPVAIIRRHPGWRWFVGDIFRTAFTYELMLHMPVVYLPDLYPEIDNDPIIIPSSSRRALLRNTEMWALAALVVHLKPRTIFEFGTHIGGGTLLLAENAKDAIIYTLNLPPEDDKMSSALKPNIGMAFKGTASEERIVALFDDSTQFNYSSFIGKIDFIFIDAAHDYRSVKSDTENALRMLSPRGIIVWHDFPSALDVRRYLLEFAKEHQVFLIYDTRLALFDPHIKQVNIREYWEMVVNHYE